LVQLSIARTAGQHVLGRMKRRLALARALLHDPN